MDFNKIKNQKDYNVLSLEDKISYREQVNRLIEESSPGNYNNIFAPYFGGITHKGNEYAILELELKIKEKELKIVIREHKGDIKCREKEIKSLKKEIKNTY